MQLKPDAMRAWMDEPVKKSKGAIPASRRDLQSGSGASRGEGKPVPYVNANA